MHFISIRQYFFKLYSAVMMMLLLPTIAFIAVYVFLGQGEPLILPSAELYAIVATVLVLDWTALLLIYAKKIKSIRKDQGLRLKLEKYFTLTIVRYSTVAFACVMLAVLFYLTQDNLISLLFGANVVVAVLFWPTPSRLCYELHLRGDEREMVYYQKDSF